MTVNPEPFRSVHMVGTVPLREYCRDHGLPYRRIVKRVGVYGWSIADAIADTSDARFTGTTDKRVRRRKPKPTIGPREPVIVLAMPPSGGARPFTRITGD